ncbi:hypothetical protein PFISCL1PPCAC_1637, partial [Pristionchus fissidentatus]
IITNDFNRAQLTGDKMDEDFKVLRSTIVSQANWVKTEIEKREFIYSCTEMIDKEISMTNNNDLIQRNEKRVKKLNEELRHSLCEALVRYSVSKLEDDLKCLIK